LVQVAVATVTRPHGLGGQVALRLRTDRPDQRFRLGAVFQVDDAAGQVPASCTLVSFRAQGASAVAGFAEIRDRDGAESMRGASLLAESAAGEEADAWYPSELRGAAVELPDGSPVGVVKNLLTGAAQDLLEIEQPDGSLALVPLVAALVPVVDAAAGRIVVDPPAGLVAARPAP
jgi:16S rRNA processing protein RimM